MFNFTSGKKIDSISEYAKASLEISARALFDSNKISTAGVPSNAFEFILWTFAGIITLVSSPIYLVIMTWSVDEYWKSVSFEMIK
jgi:hypothetical protein